MKNTSWATFTRRIPVRASIPQLYAAWATSAGLESWFLRQAHFTDMGGSLRQAGEFVQAGDNYHWLWHGWGDDHPEKRQVLAANGVDFFQFSFSGDCIVSIRIYEEQGENIVELKQEEIPEEENPEANLHVQCSNGWTFYLTNLKSILEGGLDLRNKNVALQNVVIA